ncbi:hypothetical protein LPB67_11090 [Undibacterium sp. Jales W-56]|uniref:hypothetical protein n=1 Tax=Undibacterium sp. Jales W-56 TaxID=2897325 RepID=UPI0021D32043|nr:hypothetical protein [Undibacterium sp. Jales W-56]MCU6434316.1 hypothetical protein [Undibacterium sp. Jales W-56]
MRAWRFIADKEILQIQLEFTDIVSALSMRLSEQKSSINRMDSADTISGMRRQSANRLHKAPHSAGIGVYSAATPFLP